MNTNAQWFKRGLATRVDALELALKAWADGDPDAASTIKRVARSLLEPAKDYGFPAICAAAEQVEQSPTGKLHESGTAMVKALRAEVAETDTPPSTILIVGGDPTFNGELAGELGQHSVEVLHATTGREARDFLKKQNIPLVVLNLILPDMDGRKLLKKLRSNPRGSAICVLVMSEKVSPEDKESVLSLEATGYLEGPQEVAQVSSWITARLRRAHETVKEARRDGLTGLMNRGSFLDAVNEALVACRASKEPLAIALLSLDLPAEARQGDSDATREEFVQRVALMMSTSLRATDGLARWGPDEFAAVFPGEDQFGGKCATEKVMAKLRQEAFAGPGGAPVQVSLSAGIAVVHGERSPDDAIAEADRYLFEAKSSGGDRVICNQSPLARAPRRVLIVHDDDITARVMGNLLEKEGFDVTRMSDPKQAAETTSGKERFHLILVGEGVGGGKGFVALEAIRRIPQNHRVPIVMLLTENSEESMVKALDLGANDYLTRPFDPSNFMAHMRRLVSKGPRLARVGSGIRRILVVDNDPKSLLLAASALHHRCGFRPYIAKGLKDAAGRLEEARPDVVLAAVDVALADAAAFDNLLASAGVDEKSVVMSAAPEGQKLSGVQDFTSRGFGGPIDKPYHALTLGEKVEAALGITPCTLRDEDASEQLNREIQRLSKMAEPA